jgi:hypothetical protein
MKELKDLELEKRNKQKEMRDDFSGKSGFGKEFNEQMEEQKEWLS